MKCAHFTHFNEIERLLPGMVILWFAFFFQILISLLQYSVLMICIILAEIGAGVMAVMFRVNVSHISYLISFQRLTRKPAGL